MPEDPLSPDAIASADQGEGASRAPLLERIYDDLRSIAQKRMREERGDHTLQPTALVHEAFLRVADDRAMDAAGRTQFFALASRAMRRVLIDHARAKRSRKRGEGAPAVPIDESHALDWSDPTDVLALDEALERLAKTNERQARVAELRLFGGLGLEETAEAIGVSRDTVKLDWRFARAAMNRDLRADVGDGSPE
ncbi:MAG: ECF-type sigma factor [Planctomycetota bacterium]